MRIVFMGSPEFALPALRRLIASEHEVVAVYTQPDRPTGRGRRLAPPPVKVLALDHGITVHQPRSISSAASVGTLRELAPDVGVIAAYGQILKQPVLDVPALGVLNMHASLLPRWRGAAPIPAAIMAGDAETGATIMKVVLELDAGPMLGAARLPIEDGDTTASLTPRVAAAGANLLMELLPRYARGDIAPATQDDALATYAPQLKKDDGRIDWSADTAERVWRKVRAYNPWPVAFALLDGAPLRVLACVPVAGEAEAPAGTILAREPGDALSVGFRVATVDGVIGVERVQPAGRAAMDAAAFVRGRRDAVGLRLG